jgi:hypothetical protein
MTFINILLFFKINQNKKIYKCIILLIIIYINVNLRQTKIRFIQLDSEINNIKKYYELNNNGTLINKKKFTKVNKPKVSIINEDTITFLIKNKDIRIQETKFNIKT